MKPARNVTIIHRQEALAMRLLARALDATNSGDEAALDVQLDVFEKVGKWVSIKNKLEEIGDTQLNSFKRRIHAAAGEASENRTRRAAAEPEAGGPALKRLQKRLPTAANGGADGDSNGAVGETPAATE